MKHSSARDRKVRNNILNKNVVPTLHFFRSNAFLSLNYRAFVARRFFFDASPLTKLHNYCVFTYRGHSVFREFKLSRFLIKKYVGLGLLAGLKRSSW